MTVHLRTSLFGRRSKELGRLFAAMLTLVVMVEFSVAQEKADSDATEPAASDVGAPNEPQSVPDKRSWREDRRQRDEKALLVAPDGRGEPKQAAQLGLQRDMMLELQHQQEELQRNQHQLLEQEAKMREQIARAAAELERLRQKPEQLENQRAMLEEKANAIRVKMRDLMAAQQQAKAAAAENVMLRTFKLKYIRPEQIGEALHRITGDGGPRIAFDHRTNALVISGNDKQIAVAEQLVETLDRPGTVRQENAVETLQLRIVWLLDGVEGEEPARGRSWEGRENNEGFVSPQVVKALFFLGFDNPKVVCQQLTTLTLGEERRGQYGFEVPVLINGQAWQLRGEGMIKPMTDERYALEFDLNVNRPNSSQNSQLRGSIYTPLGHYTVMGTTTFVATTPKDIQPGERLIPPGVERVVAPDPQQQHLSAFVVYLDRAREFPETASPQVDKEPLPEDMADPGQ